jgi:hypothetical protein
MSRERLAAIARSWGGLAAAAIALCSAVWLTAEYAYAVRVAPAEKALVEALKAQARTDGTVHQKLLQPEFDRQRESRASGSACRRDCSGCWKATWITHQADSSR